VKLPHLDHWIESRRQAASRYDALIERYQLGNFFAPPAVRPDLKHSFNQYVIRVAGGQRDALMRHLKADQIGCEVYYPIPLHLQESLAYLGHREGSFPVSEAAARSVLALPMFPELTQDQQERVVATCAAFARQGSRMAA
jgi:dTDP-4-amino-4,6-dideoxygalactose transaminase